MRLAATIFVFLLLLWIVTDINDACGSNMACQVEMGAPQ